MYVIVPGFYNVQKISKFHDLQVYLHLQLLQCLQMHSLGKKYCFQIQYRNSSYTVLSRETFPYVYKKNSADHTVMGH